MKKLEEFALRSIAGEHVLVPIGKTSQKLNGMINLSNTAAFIWENIERCDTKEAMVELVLEEFEVDRQTAEEDVTNFVDGLIKFGFISVG